MYPLEGGTHLAPSRFGPLCRSSWVCKVRKWSDLSPGQRGVLPRESPTKTRINKSAIAEAVPD
jgi:hypothetical protein